MTLGCYFAVLREETEPVHSPIPYEEPGLPSAFLLGCQAHLWKGCPDLGTSLD